MNFGAGVDVLGWGVSDAFNTGSIINKIGGGVLNLFVPGAGTAAGNLVEKGLNVGRQKYVPGYTPSDATPTSPSATTLPGRMGTPAATPGPSPGASPRAGASAPPPPPAPGYPRWLVPTVGVGVLAAGVGAVALALRSRRP